MPASSRPTTALSGHFNGALNQCISAQAHPLCFNTPENPECISENANPHHVIKWRTVVKLPVSCQDSRACVALFHTNLLAHCGGNHSRPPCKYKVKHSNVFCISATAPAQKQIFQIRFSFHWSSCPAALRFFLAEPSRRGKEEHSRSDRFCSVLGGKTSFLRLPE